MNTTLLQVIQRNAGLHILQGYFVHFSDHLDINPSDADATFVQSTRTQSI